MNKRVKTVLALGSALMLSLFATPLKANTLKEQKQPFSFGVKGGLVGSTIFRIDNDFKKSVYKLSFTGGLTAGYMFHENVGVGLEVLYLRLNRGVEGIKDGAQLNIDSHNLAIPWILKICPMGCDPEKGILTIELGIQDIIPMTASESFKESKDDTDKLEENKDFKKEEVLKFLTLSGLLGVSYEFPKIGLIAELRIHQGFGGIFKDDKAKVQAQACKKTFTGNPDKNVNDTFATFSVGYNFARLLNS